MYEPKPGDIHSETTTGYPRLLYAVNTMCIPFEHMIINIDDGIMQFKTTDTLEFKEQWMEIIK